MRVAFAALNAKYIHTNLAIRSVAAYARQRGVTDITLWERTINHRYRQLLEELACLDADLIIFSCYIWNIQLVRALARDLHTLRPTLVLAAAGPEVSYQWEDFLAENPAFRLVLPGEGELSVTRLLLEHREPSTLPAGALPAPHPLDLDELPFAYDDLDRLDHRLIYYESMRGCPFRCGYCLSAAQPGVRFRGLDLVFRDLERFLEAKVPQVKFVDRTFNCDRPRALAIWAFLKERDNGVTNFHFELAGELLDDEAAELLSTARPGLFQFEIGVQSTNEDTLSTINRPADLPHLFRRVEQLQAPRNIHLHLDLIAGLPREDYQSFACSFDRVYSLGPHQLQLGFLKVLKGSPLQRDAERHGILHQHAAPYEVLRTNCLTFEEISRLHSIADLVELYYNSGRFQHILAQLVGRFPSPFSFYEDLAQFYDDEGHSESPPSKIAYYDILGQFAAQWGIPLDERLQWLCKYDLALHEKIRKLPAWVRTDGASPHRQAFLDFLSQPDNIARFLPAYKGEDPKRILKLVHMEVFPFHPATGGDGPVTLLFDYTRRDLLGRASAQDLGALPQTP